MDDIDSFLDSLMQKRNAPDPSYVPQKYASSVTVKSTPTSGQGLFASQFLSSQNPILTMPLPKMMAIDSDSIPTTCYHCIVTSTHPLLHGSSNPLKTCAGCNFARFCSRDCQVKSWQPYHKYECKIFKKVKPDATFRAVMRAVLLKDRDLISNDEWDRITSLTSHSHILSGHPSTLTTMAESIKLLTSCKMGADQIQQLIFVMKFNAVELPTPVHGGIGVMLDPLFAKFNHSCEPNISIHRPQHTMKNGWNQEEDFLHVIPLRDIQPGEQLFNCYIVPTFSVKERKQRLQSDFFFDCNCSRCASDLQAAEDLGRDQPDLLFRYAKWVAGVLRHLSKIEKDKDAFGRATAAMTKSSQFYHEPTLYTTGDFPQMALGITKEAIKGQAFDEAAVNLLRLHLLVNPERFVGAHNPTNVYTSILLLDVLDVIFGLRPVSGITDEKRSEWLRKIEDRGMNDLSLMYWRWRLLADLRRRLEGGAQKDLLQIVEEREKIKLPEGTEGVKEGDAKLKEQDEMRSLLGLDPEKWKAVIERSGC